MSQTGLNDIFEVNEALNQLESEDAKIRRKAARRLGQLKDPMAIGGLVKAYQNDPDPGVKREAEAALRVFRRMELGDTGGGGRGAARLTRLFTLVLLITVIANLALLATKAFKGRTTQYAAIVPSGTHTDITDSFDKRLAELKAAHDAVRPIFIGFQGDVALKHLPTCGKLPDTTIKQYSMLPDDATTFPDLGPVNDLINIAAGKYFDLRDNYASLCTITNIADVQAKLSGQGGPGALVTQDDQFLNQYINDASAALVRAEVNPAATVGPSVTPTTAPSDTPGPTDTPAPPPTAGPTPTPLPPSDTPLPGVTPPTPLPVPSKVAPTSVPKPTATPAYSYQGLTLASLKKYYYKLLVNFSGTTAKNEPIQGTVQLFTTYQANPLVTDYEISINDTTGALKSQGLVSKFPDTLYKSGSYSYVFANNVLYQVPPSGNCQVIAMTDALRTAFAAITPESFGLGVDALSGLQLKLADQQNGLLHYNGQRMKPVPGGQSTEVYDIFVASDTKVPLHMSYQLTQPPNAKAASLTSVTVDYELLGRDDQVDMSNIVVSPNCPKQPGNLAATKAR